ncbi:TrbM/KikA/MpfK family conjugal transfer protein [Proteus mirabilis]
MPINSLAESTATSNPNDPCVVLLCMGGKVSGQYGGEECNKANDKFFSIVKKKKGRFNGGRTYDARQAFLYQCPTPDAALINKIMNQYGRVRF